ncbi:hypothetical protein [Carnobacterium maltaromaticum]|uniref:hypothetical protein n=1 Tax=Carnobacterium maltaromaticum TaxID=2751 RepID=UPI00026C8A9D|nr:hypothetical protein [Carnobacterium maltaromaticum]
MNRALFCMIIIGGIIFSPKESYASVVVNESNSHASIRFIKGDFSEEGTNTGDIENIESENSNSTNKETTFPQTGEKRLAHSELIGVSIVGCILSLTKIKKLRKEDLT